MKSDLNNNSKIESISERSDSDRLPYGVVRRRLGICYVGTIVVLAVVAIVTSMPAKVFGLTDLSSIQWFRNILLFSLVFELFGLPFDLVGYRIERIYGKTNLSTVEYLRSWCVAVVKHLALILSSFYIFTFAAQHGGVVGVGVSSLLLSVFFIWKQGEITRFLSDVLFEEPELLLGAKSLKKFSGSVPLVLSRSSEAGFTGGIVGLPGGESIVLPVAWLSQLTDAQLELEFTRRFVAVTSGSRTRGVVGAVSFTVVGVVVSSILTGTMLGVPLQSSSGAICVSSFFTVWSFVGLLLLPSINQRGVIEVDQEVVKSGAARELFYETICEIDKLMENESERSDSVQFIFHPIPTPNRRMAALDGRTTVGAWHLARYSIWLSLVGLGLLGRAVHCNAGKPQLWCMLPAD